MKRMLVLALVILSFGADALAQKDLARERVSLQFKDTPIAQVIPALAKSLGYELTLDPSLRAFLTLQVENVTAQTALTAICDSVGCRWRVEGNRLIVDARTDIVTILTENEKGRQAGRAGVNLLNYSVASLDSRLPFDITWSPVDVYVAFRMLARMRNAEVELDPALQGRKTTVSIRDASLRQAFDAVCRNASCRWELIEKPKRIVRVTDLAASGESRRVYDAKDAGLTPPRLLESHQASYTRDTMSRKVQGRVKLECVVETDGSIREVRVVESLDPELDEQAVQAVRRWKFAPGTKDGRAVPVRVEMEMSFKLR